MGGMAMSDKRALAIIYLRTQGGGGALGVAAWMIHVLQDVYDVSVLTLDRCDPEKWNDRYGTSIRTEDVKWISFEAHHPKRAAFLKRLKMVTVDQYLAMKWSTSCLAGDVVRVSANNEMAFGCRGLQYIHFPMLTVSRPDLARLIGQPGTASKEVMARVCRLLFRVNTTDLKRNYTLSNSQWTCRAYEEFYGDGTAAGWLYPPCTMSGVPDHAEWLQRDPGIVIVGRLVPMKRVEDGLRIVRGLRDLGHDLHVHVVASGGDAAYRQRLQQEFGDAEWLFWEENISRDALLALIGTHRYGMHCNHNEHFGMATAELSGSGCLVLGHNSGGTCEILPDPAQRYRSVEEGMKRLVRMHTDPELQARLLALHRQHAQTFTAEAFSEHLKRWVAEFLADPSTSAALEQGPRVSPAPVLDLEGQ